jgi:nucleoside diphosphate kinase
MKSAFSFGMLKPDCLQRQLETEAFRRITSGGLQVPLKKQIRLTQTDVSVLYSAVKDKPFYEEMSYFLISSDVIVFVVTGGDVDVIRLLNRIVGFTNPSLAKSGTLRELGQNIRRNIAHSSSNIEEALKSLHHFFPGEELVNDMFKCSLTR